jgi:hypothetical protein
MKMCDRENTKDNTTLTATTFSITTIGLPIKVSYQCCAECYNTTNILSFIVLSVVILNVDRLIVVAP